MEPVKLSDSLATSSPSTSPYYGTTRGVAGDTFGKLGQGRAPGDRCEFGIPKILAVLAAVALVVVLAVYLHLQADVSSSVSFSHKADENEQNYQVAAKKKKQVGPDAGPGSQTSKETKTKKKKTTNQPTNQPTNVSLCRTGTTEETFYMNQTEFVMKTSLFSATAIPGPPCSSFICTGYTIINGDTPVYAKNTNGDLYEIGVYTAVGTITTEQPALRASFQATISRSDGSKLFWSATLGDGNVGGITSGTGRYELVAGVVYSDAGNFSMLDPSLLPQLIELRFCLKYL
eukprot:g845.t1